MATNNMINVPLPPTVANGGTGQSSLTAHSVLVGNTTSGITQLSLGTNGQPLLGSSAADPAFGTVTSSGSTLTLTTGAASLGLDVANWATGTWTPTIVFIGGVGVITYSVQQGIYYRLNNMVWVAFYIALTSKGVDITRFATIGSLPFTISALTPTFFNAVAFGNMNTTGGNVYVQAQPSVTALTLYVATSGSVLATGTNANFTDTTVLKGVSQFIV